jgi:crotonobetainyl-CoA:carnitine CoA-transferase CaiB-like acyl-CoA transferase
MEPHGMFRCKGEDAWVAVAVENDRQWRSLATLCGRWDLAADNFAERRRHPAEIHRAIEEWTLRRTHLEAQALMQAAGVPAAAVLNAAELLADPHVQAYAGFEYVETPSVGPTPYPRVAFRLSGTPVPVSGPAPGFGEGNSYVLGEVLGRPAAEVEALRRDHMITDEPQGVSH